jgi:hypothetical protein
MSLQRNKSLSVVLLYVVLLSIAAAAANASPTMTADSAIVPTIQRGIDSQTKAAPNNEATEPTNSKLADIGREFRTPPVISTNLIIVASAAERLPYAKSLPAVPKALLMALTGFLCVSLIKDRRVWLAVLTGMLWLGQAGIQALPQLASRLSYRNYIEQQSSSKLYPYYLEDFSRLRSDIKGTRYIGLLYHLAGIPNIGLIRDSRFSQASSVNKPQPALISKQYTPNPLFKCWTYQARQHIRFSPAFIFQNLPRGPPKQA